LNKHLFSLSLIAAVLWLASTDAVAQDDANDVKSWLDRMNVAVEELNYRGTFVHAVERDVETLQIAHRNTDGEVREKISSPEGSGREILRTADGVRSVFPEKRLVMFEESQGSTIPLAAALNYTNALESYYDMKTLPKGQVAGRDTQVVSIRAKDEYRYGYLLWLDRETALPLRSEVRDENGRVIETILFTEIEVVDALAESEVAPAIDVEGFEWKRPIKAKPEASSNEVWGATRLPNGFRLSIARQSLLAGSRYPVQHLVYTDGLATVSVFIAHPKSDADMPEGFSQFGSTNVYTLKVDGRLATAMGEVPRRTVQRIATSLDAR
jgi:sigma-E factor negative regulatory protein RseB